MRTSGLLPLINKLREVRRDPYSTSDECIVVSAKEEIDDALELINIYLTDATILFDVFSIEQLTELFELMDILLGGNLPGVKYTIKRNLKYNLILIYKVPKNVRTTNKEISKLLRIP